MLNSFRLFRELFLDSIINIAGRGYSFAGLLRSFEAVGVLLHARLILLRLVVIATKDLAIKKD